MQNNPVCFLLGAGASKDVGLPTMPEMYGGFLAEFALASFKHRLRKASQDLARKHKGSHNIELLLAALQKSNKCLSSRPVSTSSHHSLFLRQREDAILAHEIRKFILHSVSKRIDIRPLQPLRAFIRSTTALDVFSLNYDTVVETFCRRLNVPLADGFDRSGKWTPRLFNQQFEGVRLWKLHGSTTWTLDPFRRLRRTLSPKTFARRIEAGHAAPVTAETALIWPATPKFIDRSLEILQEAFRKRLTECRILVVVGYSFADLHIRQTVQQALKSNSVLRILLVCGSRHNAERLRRLLAATPRTLRRIRIITPGYFGTALKSGRLKSEVVRATRRFRSHRPRVLSLTCSRIRGKFQRTSTELICPGHFDCLTPWKNGLLLADTGELTSLYHLDRNRSLHTIASWRGNITGAIPLSHQVLAVVDSRLSNSLTGWGTGWLVTTTGSRRRMLKAAAGTHSRAGVLSLLRHTVNAKELIKLGMFSWPTSLSKGPNRSEVLVTEARRVLSVDTTTRQARPLTERRFFNLMHITALSRYEYLLIENVRGHEGAIWLFNALTGSVEPFVSGIFAASSIAVSPDRSFVLFSEARSYPNGKLWRINVRRRTMSIVRDCLDKPTAIAFLGQTIAAVATSEAVVGIQF